VQRTGLQARLEVGTGGASVVEELATRDVGWAIGQVRRFLETGASMILIESEGITESVAIWRTDAVAKIINALHRLRAFETGMDLIG